MVKWVIITLAILFLLALGIAIHHDYNLHNLKRSFCESEGMVYAAGDAGVVRCINRDGDMKYYNLLELKKFDALVLEGER